MSAVIDGAEFKRLIAAKIKEHGTQANYARALGIAPQQFNRSLKEGNVPDAAILADLGFKKQIVYCKKENEDG